MLVEGNLFEYNWPHAQGGFAILLTVRNQDGGAPWSVVEDVAFVSNHVRHVGSGINILARDDNRPSQQAKRIAIANNLFEDVGGAWGGGRLFQLLAGPSDVVIERNTAVHTDNIITVDGEPLTRFVYTDNITPHNAYGIIGSGTGPGRLTIDKYFPGGLVKHNVIAGGNANQYPPKNLFPASLDEIGFVNRARGDYRLAPSSRIRKAGTGGRDPGVDVDRLIAAMSGVAPAGTASEVAPRLRAGVFAPMTALLWLSLGLLAYVYVGYPALMWVRAARRLARQASLEGHPEGHHRRGGPQRGAQGDGASRQSPGARLSEAAAGDHPGLRWLHRRDGRAGACLRAPGSHRAGFCPATRKTVQCSTRSCRRPLARLSCLRMRDNGSRPRRSAPWSGHLRILALARSAASWCSPEAPRRTAAGDGVGFYWRYEKLIRQSESRTHSTVGATGAIYAVRRSLFTAIPADTILDDVVIPMNIVRQGYRVLFESGARAYDRVSATARDEFTRKVRTIAGYFQLFGRHRWLLSPVQNPLWFQTLSHKGARLVTPLLHLTALVANVAVAADPGYGYLLGGQLLFYAVALGGFAFRNSRRRLPLVGVPFTICLLSWATVVAFARYSTGRQRVTWDHAPI